MQSNLKKSKLILFSITLLVLFTYPLISIANKTALLAGFPVLFLYIFFVWLIAIAVLYKLAEGKQKKPDE